MSHTHTVPGGRDTTQTGTVHCRKQTDPPHGWVRTVRAGTGPAHRPQWRRSNREGSTTPVVPEGASGAPRQVAANGTRVLKWARPESYGGQRRLHWTSKAELPSRDTRRAQDGSVPVPRPRPRACDPTEPPNPPRQCKRPTSIESTLGRWSRWGKKGGRGEQVGYEGAGCEVESGHGGNGQQGGHTNGGANSGNSSPKGRSTWEVEGE